MSQVDQIQVELKHAQEIIKDRDALDRLRKNKDFKRVIDTLYFKEEAARLVMARANSALNDEQQRHILMMIDGVGCLVNFFDTVERRGSDMDVAIKDYEEALEEVAREEASS